MKKILLYSVLSFFCSALTAQADLFYPISQIPDSLLTYANEVVREELTEFRVESLHSGSLTYRKVVSVLNDKSDAHREVVFYDEDSKIRRFKANLYDALGNLVRKIDKDEIKDYSAVADFSIYQDDRMQVLEIRHSQYPYTVEVEYEMRVAGHRYCTYPTWYIQQFGTAVEHGKLVLDLPAGMAFHQQILNIDLEARRVADKNREIYTWEVEQLKALRPESYLPPRTQILPVVITSPDNFQWGKYEGSMASWEAYGHFMGNLFDGRDELPEAAVTEIRDLAAGAGSSVEKVQRLYRYLQENMRYVSVQLGIGGWQPFDAAYVNEKRYGDCKALSNYMKAVLSVAGVEAYPALIYNGDADYEVQEDFTVPRFNHMILYVPGDDLWLECTSNSYPPGYIGQRNSDRNALLITPQGGALKRTPVLMPEDNIEAHRATVQLSENGQASLEVSSHFYGADHEIFRSLQHQLSLEDQKKWLLRQQDDAGFSLQEYQLDCDKDRPRSQLAYSAQVAHYAQKAGKRLFVPIKSISPALSIPPNNDHRLYPVDISRSYTERDTVAISFPEGYTVESAPEPEVNVTADFGSYRHSLQIEGDRLVYIRELTIKACRLPADRYAHFRDFYKKVVKADGAQMVLKKE
ncbi:DUF3857 domain-containing transglutaminase family protein [Flavilitoribacter nigricans]|uniref:DUF3857 domain-containing protein n=1 Tax=Flavilitoribacter nigricans (strain ATCC 23147 / DSM 23189 / NBRC 102662 / NCIMB 1420 / SS-2) TaxID=1122177 RepID=A0A2D0NAH6_FLAN2|nr:DUF3857 domain-containing protein [Flavilitoribacter nigricans]PHN05487.1 hypothetical protein CRP01_15950 [Flavilitoribacter nigricans DSM 23189 = NBRC 102662]